MNRKDPKLSNLFNQYLNLDKPKQDLLSPALIELKKNTKRRMIKRFINIFSPIMVCIVLILVLPDLILNKLAKSNITQKTEYYQTANLSSKSIAKSHITNYNITLPDFSDIISPSYTVFTTKQNEEVLLLYKFRNITEQGIDEVKIYYEINYYRISNELAKYRDFESYYYNNQKFNYDKSFINGEYVLRVYIQKDKRPIYLDIMSKNAYINDYLKKVV